MKTIGFLLLIVFATDYACGQSTAPYPTRSRFYSNRYKGFTLKDGDILLYTISKDTTTYNLVITVKKYSNAINLAYSINAASPGEATKNGKISIPEKTVNEAYKYDTLITDSMALLKDEIICWMSKKNLRELYYIKESLMDMGNGKETFIRGNTSTMKIKIKGRESLVTFFKMENKSNKSKKYINVLTDDANPMITKLDAGKWTMALKEVR